MAEKGKLKSFLRDNWLFLFVIMQPLLDVLAFWTSSEAGTAAGYVRLLFMIILPCHLLLTSKDRKKLFCAYAIIGLLAVLHVGNLFRVGYINVVSDVKNMAKIFYLPVMAVSMCAYVRDDRMKNQLVKGVLVNCFILAAVIVVSYITGTYNPTYGYGLGTSAWVTDQNRCTHSIILSALSIFAMYFGMSSEKKIWNYLVPPAVLLACLTNGTSSCYLTLLACLGGFPVFMVFRSLVCREKMHSSAKILVVYLLVLAVAAVAVYPVTPRAKITAIERAAAEKRQGGLEAELIALGYDIHNMSPEEKMNEPVVREKMAKFYTETIYGGAPGLIETFDVYRIMEAYGMWGEVHLEAECVAWLFRLYQELTEK